MIEQRGHAAGKLEDSHGHVCIRGALGLALTGNAFQWWGGNIGTFREADLALARWCADLNPYSFGRDEAHVHWNNSLPDGSEELVAKTMRACADALDDIADQR